MHHDKEYFIISSKIVYFEEEEFVVNPDHYEFTDENRKEKIVQSNILRAVRTLVKLEGNNTLRVKETPEEIVELLD